MNCLCTRIPFLLYGIYKKVNHEESKASDAYFELNDRNLSTSWHLCPVFYLYFIKRELFIL